MKEAYLIPLEGLMVRDPVSKTPLTEKGEMKPMAGYEGTYWKRRVADGTVRIGELPTVKLVRKTNSKGE